MLYIGIQQQIIHRQGVRLLNVAVSLHADGVDDGRACQLSQLLYIMHALAAVQLDNVDNLIAHERGNMLRFVVHEHADRLNFRVKVLLEPRRV